MVLTRNGQSLAAIQNQGRLLHTWTEIVYDGRGYRLFQAKGHPGRYIFADEAGDELLAVEPLEPTRIRLHRAIPLPLLVMATMRTLDETNVGNERGPSTGQSEESQNKPMDERSRES
jgi:hypothetical protein